MKKLLSIALLAFMVIGCAKAQDINFTLQGTAPQGTDSLMVYFNSQMRKKEVVKVKDGKFTVTGSQAKNTFVTVLVNRESVPVSAIIDTENIAIDLTSNTVSGSSLNDVLNTYQQKEIVQYSKTMQLYQEYRKLRGEETDEAKAKMKALEDQMDENEKQETQAAKEFILANKGNVLPAYVLSKNYYNFEFAGLKDLCAENTGYYSHPLMERPLKQLKALAKRQPGIKYTDLSMNDMDGKPAKLSQWIGKGYVLVDFWASWCGPCRMEMPHVKEAYEKYHAKGFEVIGVSFDSKAEAWKKGVGDLSLPWPQISDLKGWQCAAAEAYGVNAIPSNVLVNADGVIVAADLRGEDLLSKLAEIYKEK